MIISRKRFCCCLFLCGIAFVLAGFLMDAEDFQEDQVYDDPRNVFTTPENGNESDVEYRYKKVYLPKEDETRYPIIVWWTAFTGYQRVVWNCARGSCLFTHSRTEFDNPLTEAFMFYGTDIAWDDLPIPRKPHHLWGVIHEESVKNNWILGQSDGIQLFNLTSTFSRYSNFPVVLQFLEAIDDLTKPPLVSTAEKNRLRSSLAPVIYLHSDCDPPSDRDSYMRELMKYIQVDSYGKCLHNKDLPEHLVNPLTYDTNDLHAIQAQYKFSISFENALCHDYITEKFWRPLSIGSVPVVRGSPTIKDWAPRDSIIIAEEFKSPKELAEYLLYLDKHDDEYEKFLKYKTDGIGNERLSEAMESRAYVVNEIKGKNSIEAFECYVCDKIIERKELLSEGKQPEPLVANLSHIDCLAPHHAVDSVDVTVASFTNSAEIKFWIWHEMCSRKQAKLVRELVESGQPYGDDFETTLREACLDVTPG